MRFQVFKNGKVLDKFPLYGAYVFGTDGIAVRQAEVEFKNGFIECRRHNLTTVGLALLWPVDGFGKVLLPTTCLPDRDRPYNLNVEMARGKLTEVIKKCEDWAFFDGVAGLQDISRQAQDLFIKAMQNIFNPPVAAKLADESLKRAMVLGEKLAITQAESSFQARGTNRGFGRGCLGCQIEPEQINNRVYLEAFLTLFGCAAIPLNWGRIEFRRGIYDFSKTDRCLEVLAKKKLTIAAGPLLCFSPQHLPKWLIESNADFEMIRETAYQFVFTIVSRYSRIVRTWRVVNGLNALNHFGFNFEQIMEMTRAANMATKAASDGVQKIIEVANPWGEYYATVGNTIPPLVYMDMTVQSGIAFDGFGVRMRFGKNQAGMHIRDIMQISAMLDFFAAVAKPLHITEVEVPSQRAAGPHSGSAAGIWHEQWDEAKQAQWIEQFYKVAFSKPFVETVTYANFADTKHGAVANSSLLKEGFEPKQAFRVFKKLHKAIFAR